MTFVLAVGAWVVAPGACALPEASKIDGGAEGGRGGQGGGGAGPGLTADLVVGWSNGCVLNEHGDIFCWGDNSYGAVGNGAPVTAWSAQKVVGLAVPAVQLAAGFQFHCALLEGAAVWCWGRNQFGAFGTSGDQAFPSPVPVPALGGALELAAGYGYLCGLMPDASVQCMGDGSRGQLGPGHGSSIVPVGIPMPVGFGEPVELVSASAASVVCALDAERRLACWGAGHGPTLVSAGPVGAAAVGRVRVGPEEAGGFDEIAWTEAGGGHFARDDAANWPNDGPLPAPEGTLQLAFGDESWCLRLDTGGVGCGGFDVDGSPVVTVPVGQLAGHVSVDIGAGTGFVCTREASGTVLCWGANGYGQLGNGHQGIEYAPLLVAGVSAASRVFVGEQSTVAVVGAPNAPGLVGWGNAAAFGLTPALPEPLPTFDGKLFEWVAFDGAFGEEPDAHALMIDATNGALARFSGGIGVNSELGAPGIVFRQAYGASGAFDVGLLAAAQNEVQFYVRQPGINADGILGDGTAVSPAVSTTPQLDVSGAAEILAFRRDARHMCALVGQQVLCWGANDLGQVGAANPTLEPRFVLGGQQDVCVGRDHSCSVGLGGDVSCWGSNYDGQAGQGNAAIVAMPEAVGALSGIDRVVCGRAYTCAWNDADAWCWGANDTGQLGLGDTLGRNAPVHLALSEVIDVAASSFHTCAVVASGAVYCWGAADYGQVGNGTTQTEYTEPGAVVGIGG